MSLTDLSLALWRHPQLPVAALVAHHAATLSFSKLDPADREVFGASFERLTASWAERRKRSLAEVWGEASPEPLRLASERKGNAGKAADLCVRALYIQVANLERVGGGRRALPPDCYGVEDEDLEKLLRAAIRVHGHTQVRDLARRLGVLEELAKEAKWPAIVEAAGRMGWTRLRPGLSKLPLRLRALGEALDVGGDAEMVDVGGRAALRVTTIGGERRVGVLSDEEMNSLAEVVPWIPGGA